MCTISISIQRRNIIRQKKDYNNNNNNNKNNSGYDMMLAGKNIIFFYYLRNYSTKGINKRKFNKHLYLCKGLNLHIL